MANNNHFELTLDTLAPTGSISGLGHYEKDNKVLTIVGNDAVFKKVWFDSLDESAVSKNCDGYLSAEWEAKDAEVTSAFTATGIYYYHLVLMDDVNNESEIYTLGPVNYDQDVPVVKNVHIQDIDGKSSSTNRFENEELQLSFEFSDVGSGIAKAIISGDIKGDPVTIIPSASDTKCENYGFSFKPDDTDNEVKDGPKTIYVTVVDKAGNSSVTVVSNTLLLDRVLDKPSLVLKKGEAILPAYINYREFTACLALADPLAAIEAYKIWEGDIEPETWVSQESGPLNVEVSMTFSDGDGVKIVHAKVRDTSGNISEALDRQVTIDSQPPVAEIKTDKEIISKIDGYNKAILTFEQSADNEGGSGIEYYELRRNDTVISFGETLPANYEVTIGALADGIYNYELFVRDRAKNETLSSKATITFDTASPEVSIVPLNTWYNDKFDATVSYSDVNKLVKMMAWYSTVTTDETLPDYPIVISPTVVLTREKITGDLVQSDSNYLHVAVVDEVGNIGFAHAKFGFDNIAPEIKLCKFSSDAYHETSATINLNCDDGATGSKVAEMRFSGDITEATPEGTWEKLASIKGVQLTSGDGLKTVLVEVRDNAGNESSKEISCELDTVDPSYKLTVYEADYSHPKANNSAIASFALRLEVYDDSEANGTGNVEYRLYGDFNFEAQSDKGIGVNEAEWTTFVADEGKPYKSISNLYCTSGDGVKNIYVQIRDNAGNESDVTTPKSFEYDTTEPVVVVKDIDFNRISKVHVERRNSAGILPEIKYADQVYFTIKPDSEIQAYKVCAYADAATAAAVTDVENEVAIGTTNGSLRMSGSGLRSSAEIVALINGADYEAALGGSDEHKVDGAHIVVVYVQDLAGTWSVAAQF